MPVPIVRLPELQYPNNALLDFSGINKALDDRNRVAEINARLGLEQQRVGQEGERIGIERQRAGYEGQRVGFEERRTGLAEQQARQQQEEQDRVRLGNMAASINQIQDDATRAQAWSRLVNSTPRLGEALRNSGQDPMDHRTGPQFIMSQVQDYQQRYQPHVVAGAPGSVLSEVAPGPGGATVRPLLAVPQRAQNLSVDAIKGLRDEGNQLQSLTRLSGTFNPAYTSSGLLPGLVGFGDIRNWYGRHSSTASPETRAAAEWWQDYQRSVELTQRHAMFGSALTAPEQAAWRAATITPNMAPDAIRNNLAVQNQILQNGITRYARSLVSAGYDPGPISEAYGVPPQALGIPATRQVTTLPVGPGGAANAAPGASGAPSAAPSLAAPGGPAQPQPGQAPAAGPQEGAIYRNPQTGQRIILRNGQWQPL